MITKIAKTSVQVLDQVAGFVPENTTYLKHTFPQCSSKDEVLAELRKSTEQWCILVTDRPAALFTLHFSDMNAK